MSNSQRPLDNVPGRMWCCLY